MWTRAAFALPLVLFPAACGKSFESTQSGSGGAAVQASGGKDSGVGAGPSAGRSGAGGAPSAAGGHESAGGGVSEAGGANPGTGGRVSVGGANAGGANAGGANAGGANAGGANAGGTNAGGTNVGTGGKPGTNCTVVVKQEVDEGADHSVDCAKLTYGSNPPSSGTHYPSWAAFKLYSNVIPEGYWVHDLEHGAVVITYNCASGCAAEIAQIEEMINALPTDALCVSAGQGVLRRIVVTPDPKLTTRFAASAWNWTLRAPCFDRGAFEEFIAAHYGHGSEDICGNGTDLSVDAFPAGCGE